MLFSTGGGALKVAVNDKAVGSIGSKALAKAFANIYCDGKAVCDMAAVGADGEVASSKGGLITPFRGAALGAFLGYKLGKAMS